jgi:S-disulfanyl-L-cysteine oxidoreductase SoxD
VLNKSIFRRSLLGVGGAAMAPAVVWLRMHALAAPVTHLADANDNIKVGLGKHSYRLYCASCHGRALQGQPLWQLKDKDAGRRAPAHDASGHTWQHSDEALFQITKYGRFASMPAGPSRMPAFKDRLTDDQILAIIAFIKRSWPIGLRASQAMLNPRYAGMPPEASRAAWRFPPTCRETLARAASTLGPGFSVEGVDGKP